MRKREVLIGAGLGAAAALVGAPAVELAVESVIGDPHAQQVFAGALLATAFFGITALTAAAFQNTKALRTAVMLTYVIKTALVIVAIELISMSPTDGRIFAVSLTISAVVYLFFQTTYIARWRRFRAG